MISILFPSRGRPDKCKDTLVRWSRYSSGGNDFELILSLDSDDPLINLYPDKIAFEHCSAKVVCNKNRSAVDAINNAAKVAEGSIFIVVSDDTHCPDLWDYHLLNETGLKKDFILKTKDGVQHWIITNPIMDRTYYNRFGYIYHPDYKHMFCDTELTCVADLTGRKITSNILFKHNHYSVTKEPPDAISKRADGTWDHGEKLFLERYKRNFDLPPDQIKGKIEDNGMIRWLQRKAR